MTVSQALIDLDVHVDHLRNSDASLEQGVEALLKLERALKEVSIEPVSDGDRTRDERNLARAAQISGMTQLGQLRELASLDNSVDAEVTQHLRALCGMPMSKELEADFIAVLDRVKKTAEQDAERLQDLRKRTERDQAYRNLLQDMQHLLNELLSGAPAGATANPG